MLLPPADFKLDSKRYSRLGELGFRRGGEQVYRPHCPNCQACVSCRVPVARFQANRSQRRCLRRHQTTQTFIKPAAFDPEQYALYRRYHAARHADDEQPEQISPESYMDFFVCRWQTTRFVEFRQAERLFAVAVVDWLDHGLSAVYTFFDPEAARLSPGVYAVLWQIEHAKELGLEYVYLGYWIENCRKMQYKIAYQPLEGRIGQNWLEIGE